MNQKNLEYLSTQLKFLGFKDVAEGSELAKHLEGGPQEFKIESVGQFNNDQIKATLQFWRPEDPTSNYQFSRFELALKKEGSETTVNQTFYINNKTNKRELLNAGNFTIKEAYNLLSGRPVYKNFLDKDNAMYYSWAKLDLNDKDKYNNYPLKKKQFDLTEKLEGVNSRLSIIEMKTAEYREDLINSLQKGNRQSFTAEVNGVREKMYLEVNLMARAFNLFDKDMKPVSLGELTQTEKQTEGQKEQQKEQQNNGQKISTGKTVKESLKNKDQTDGSKKKNSNKQGMKMS